MDAKPIFPALRLWKDLTPVPEPLVKPTDKSKTILVVGGGITGLVTAWTLLDHGYKVTILSKAWATFSTGQRLTSQIAGALWEFPPAVCGQHKDAVSLAHSKRWCMVAYHIWRDLATDIDHTDTGVRMRPSAFLFPYTLEDDPAQLAKMGIADAFEFLAPIIDTDAAMAWLMQLVRAKGTKMVTGEVDGDLLHLEAELRGRYAADVIVNCTGLAGTTLAGDKTCYPIRGGLVRVANDGRYFPREQAALCISADATGSADDNVFIVPRNDNVLLLGDFAQPHNSALDLTLDSPIVQDMRARCEAFLPDLKRARLDPEYSLAQGLRPFRQHNVRVERELRPSLLRGDGKPNRIVRSYGHGGAGWSLSFGCAGDVLGLVEEALRDVAPTPMGGKTEEGQCGTVTEVSAGLEARM